MLSKRSSIIRDLSRVPEGGTQPRLRRDISLKVSPLIKEYPLHLDHKELSPRRGELSRAFVI